MTPWAGPPRSSDSLGVELLDLVGGSKHFWLTHMHGFLGPRAYHALSMVASPYRSSRRAAFSARDCFRSRCPLGENILASVLRGDADEAWILLTEVARPPTQTSKDQALAWTTMHGQAAMRQLLLQHGARDQMDTQGWLDDQGFEDEAFIKMCQTSMRHKPSPSDVLRGWSVEERAREIARVGGMASVVPLGTIFRAVLLADRFFAAAGEAAKGECPSDVVSVCFGLTVKIDGRASSGVMRRIHGPMSRAEISRLERLILPKVGCELDVPSPEALLDGLCARTLDAAESLFQGGQQLDRQTCKNVASNILLSAIMDPHVFYMHSPIVLVAAALACAIVCCRDMGPELSRDEQENMALLHLLLAGGLAVADTIFAPVDEGLFWAFGERLLKHCVQLHSASPPGWDGMYALERINLYLAQAQVGY
mmetsp:Transcript_84558/g.244293  ORF Transcript_84558/g.244293 Transcript_84558/m.244293 type:complete len:423 (-) Transcript_84558:533-1801(-)|eukprot:CAMPEP_0170298528 /NCGR_PEP_ID=MMETSP0116_2-20130129/49447_1 /TAXON_ID=400756 /ORGANISM="Durinskia baltica, Strain CSIRO CS-38" /LENGTH=422 /DNA_ID=CAMNT_0010550197 /DNA_START=60 /DNA_END=1328 /DNA_ORIENTATION=+